MNLSFKAIFKDLFYPSAKNSFVPGLLNARAFFYYGLLVFIVTVIIFSPLTKTLPYRVFLANLSGQLILDDVNPQRTSGSLAPLRVDPLLSDAARMKAEDMIARNYFSHLGPNGELPWVWFDRLGYKYSAAGENLAIDFSDPNALVSAWMASPTHAANIRNGTFSDVGIGLADGVFQGRKTTIVVMFLGQKAIIKTQAVTNTENVVPPTTINSNVSNTTNVSVPAPAVSGATVAVEQVPVATNHFSETIDNKVSELEKSETEVLLEKPLMVRTLLEAEPAQVASEDTSLQAAHTDTLSLFFVKGPALLRILLSSLFTSMLLLAIVAFMVGKHWAPLLISRASALVLFGLIMWLPRIF